MKFYIDFREEVTFKQAMIASYVVASVVLVTGLFVQTAVKFIVNF